MDRIFNICIIIVLRFLSWYIYIVCTIYSYLQLVVSYLLFIVFCTIQQFEFVFSHSTIVSYVLFIISWTMCQFQFMCSLFVLFSCLKKNTQRPLSNEEIGASHHFLPPAAPQEPIVELLFRTPAPNRQSDRTALSLSGTTDQSSLPRLPLQSIFNWHAM